MYKAVYTYYANYNTIFMMNLRYMSQLHHLEVWLSLILYLYMYTWTVNKPYFSKKILYKKKYAYCYLMHTEMQSDDWPYQNGR